MNKGIERRRYRRAPLDLPVFLQTPKGVIKGKTANISAGGLALLLFLEKPEIEEEFQVTINMPDSHEISVTCKEVWSGSIVTDDSVYNAIGVQFTQISDTDREFIASLVEEYYLL